MRLVNISIDIYNILIGTVLFISLVPNHYMKEKLRNCFNIMIIINIINLYKLNNTKKEYAAVSTKAQDGFLSHFLLTSLYLSITHATPADTSKTTPPIIIVTNSIITDLNWYPKNYSSGYQ